MLSVKVIPGKGNAATFKNMKGMPARVRKGIQKAFITERTEFLKDTKEDMGQAKHGRDYFVFVGRGGRKLKKGRWHRASKKGESPAVLTGALRKSLGFQIKRGRTMTYGANTPYARKHEIEGRTYLLRTIQKKKNELGYRIKSDIEKELRRVKP